MTENEVSRVIIIAAIEVHRVLGGPGLLESVYEEALVQELSLRGYRVDRQVQVPIIYKGIVLSQPLRLDLIVENLVIVECKAIPVYSKRYEAQTLTYLRLRGLRLGLVINFGEPLLKTGIHRVVNNLR